MTGNNKLMVEMRDEWMSKGKGGDSGVLLRQVEHASLQVALTHADMPAVFGIPQAARVKVLQTANPKGD